MRRRRTSKVHQVAVRMAWRHLRPTSRQPPSLGRSDEPHRHAGGESGLKGLPSVLLALKQQNTD